MLSLKYGNLHVQEVNPLLTVHLIVKIVINENNIVI